MCVLGAPKPLSTTTPCPTDSGGGASANPVVSSECAQPTLVSGVVIRHSNLALSDVAFSGSSLGMGGTSPAVLNESEVQALNQVNQAISEDTSPQIIAGQGGIATSSVASHMISEGASTSSTQNQKPSFFLPYLLVHDISSPSNSPACTAVSNSSRNNVDTPSLWMKKTMGGSTNIGGKTLVSQMQNIYVPMDIVDDDDDVQIVGIIPPPLKDPMLQMSNGPPVLVPPKAKVVVGTPTEQNALMGDNRGSIDSGFGRLGHLVNDQKEGRAVQCIKLPSIVGPGQYISSITPSPDGRFVIVITAPKELDKKLDLICSVGVEENETEMSPDVESGNGLETLRIENTISESSEECSRGGCVLVYRVLTDSGLPLLEETPLKSCVLDSIEDAVTSLSVLNSDIVQVHDDEDSGIQDNGDNGHMDSDSCNLEYHLIVTTFGGQVKVIHLVDFKVLVMIEPPEGDKFVSVTYCTGIERLCCCSGQGKLHFYMVSPHHIPQISMDTDEPVTTVGSNSSPIVGTGVISEDIVDSDQLPKAGE